MWKSLAIGVGAALGFALLLIGIANSRFDHQTDGLVNALLAAAGSEQHVVAEEDLMGLPVPVQQWLRNSGILGQMIPRTIRLQQRGEIRLGPDQPWMPFRADQFYTIDPIAFVWRVSAIAAPGIFIRGVDSLIDGTGHMVMKPLALFSVVDASGPTLDQGTALRYLQEIVWFPFAALSPAIDWQPIDNRSARATLTLETISVSGAFFFDEEGQIVDFRALRYRDDTLEWWRTPMTSHRELNSALVPTEGEGVWGTDDAPFVYIRVHLTGLEYDIAETY